MARHRDQGDVQASQSRRSALVPSSEPQGVLEDPGHSSSILRQSIYYHISQRKAVESFESDLTVSEAAGNR